MLEYDKTVLVSIVKKDFNDRVYTTWLQQQIARERRKHLYERMLTNLLRITVASIFIVSVAILAVKFHQWGLI